MSWLLVQLLLLQFGLAKSYYGNTVRYPAANVHHQAKQCDIPPDFWFLQYVSISNSTNSRCDSYEAAQRCNVVQQCETFRRNPSPLTVTLMYEALCPYCQRFIANTLGNLHNRFGNRINIDLIPWGNSILLRNGQISCNHGPKECDANRMMSCVIDEVSSNQAIPFIICFERALSANSAVEQAMHQCSSFIRNKYKQIKQCYVGERGIQLQKQAAQRTMSAKANPIVEVPYVVVNNYSPNTDANAVDIIAIQYLVQKWLNLRQ